MKFFSPPPPAPGPGAPPTASKTAEPSAPSATPPAGSPAAGTAAVAGAPGTTPPAAPAVSVAEHETTIETPAERFVFSNRGASLRHATLLEKKYLPKKGEEGAHANGIDLVHPGDAKRAPLRIE